MTKECAICDGTGSVCGACSASIMDCNCGPDQEPMICDACAGSGDAPTRAADAAMLDAIMSKPCERCGVATADCECWHSWAATH